MGRGGGGELVGSGIRDLFSSLFESGLRDFLSRVAGGRVRLDCRLFSSGCTKIYIIKVHKTNTNIINADLEYLLGKRYIVDELCFVKEFLFEVFVNSVGIVATRLWQNHMYLKKIQNSTSDSPYSHLPL